MQPRFYGTVSQMNSGRLITLASLNPCLQTGMVGIVDVICVGNCTVGLPAAYLYLYVLCFLLCFRFNSFYVAFNFFCFKSLCYLICFIYLACLLASYLQYVFISSSLTFYFCLSCPKTCLLNVQYVLLYANSIHLFLTGFILMFVIFAIMTSNVITCCMLYRRSNALRAYVSCSMLSYRL